MTNNIRVTARNNSDARSCSKWLPGSRHNGGKLVLITVDASDLAAIRETLEEAHEVAGYEVQA